jgi:hypothetical protein
MEMPTWLWAICSGRFFLNTQPMAKNKNKQHRFEIYTKGNFTCAYCLKVFIPPLDWDRKEAIHSDGYWLVLDHIIPLALGGSDAKTNKQCLCGKCNQYKGALTMPYFHDKMLRKRDIHFDKCFLFSNRIARSKSRGLEIYERDIFNFRKHYEYYKYFQKVVVTLNKLSNKNIAPW